MRFTHTNILLLCVSVLSGCTALTGPEHQYTQQAKNEPNQLSDWSSHSADTVAAVYLNDLLSSDTLDQLITEAISANPSLQQTLLTLKIREQQLSQTGASLKPQVDAGFGASRQQNSDNSYSSSLTISWQADLWGELSNNSKAAASSLAEQQALLAAAQSALSAEVMQAWLGLIAQQHKIDLQQQRLQSLKQTEIATAQRYRSGLGELSDLNSARSSVASAEASLLVYQQSYREQQQSLKILLGRYHSADITPPTRYPEVGLTLTSLPSQDLSRRPDLIAAYQAIQSADYSAKASYRQLLPSISLSAALEDVASSPRASLFTSPTWSLLAQLTAPLYQGGELRAAAKISELEAEQAYQAYRETLLNAVGEVENALLLEQSLQQQQAQIAIALENGIRSRDQYRTRYRQGLADILDLLSLEQQVFDLKADLDDLRYQQLNNRITLGLALGLGVED